MPISIIIPAHNEQAVIERCLAALTSGAAPGELDIIVVCNGCTDRTAERVRAFGKPVRVIETEVPSKSNALNLGDAAARAFPRFYVDADVVLPLEAVRRVAAELAKGDTLAAAPRMRVDLAGCSWAVRTFYDIWLRLPYHTSGMIGSGVFALSAAGRSRFDRFPTITADDGFARLHFAAGERVIVESCWFTLHPPRTVAGLVAIKTRAHFGNLELHARYPQLWKNEEAAHRSGIGALLVNPWRWPAITVYVLVRIVARRRAARRWRRGDHACWERDDSSRELATAGNR